MQQEHFENGQHEKWQLFARWLQAKPKKAGQVLASAEIPRRYRELCQHLTLARDRQYSSGLIDRLHELVLAGHQRLYDRRVTAGGSWLRFIRNDFPVLVRNRWKTVVSASLLLFGPMLTMIAVLQFYPEFVNYLIGPENLNDFQRMYNPASEYVGRPRGAESHWYAFSMYIWNNVRIDFQCFAGGLLFGIGAIFFLFYNGLYIGAIAGYLTELGYVQTFWGFVAGHSAFELLGAALSGAAGLEVGMALVAPGQLTRVAALKLRTKTAIKILYGAVAMTLFAAFIEAFWSSMTWMPVNLKYGVGIVLWILLLTYFLFVGRPQTEALRHAN